MRTDKMGFDSSYWGTYKGNLAFQLYGKQYKCSVLVFKDISAKRYKPRDHWTKTNEISKRRNMKVLFITNEQVLDLYHPLADQRCMQYARSIISDRKAGSRYYSYGQSCSISGDYLDCLGKDRTTPKVAKKPIYN